MDFSFGPYRECDVLEEFNECDSEFDIDSGDGEGCHEVYPIPPQLADSLKPPFSKSEIKPNKKPNLYFPFVGVSGDKMFRIPRWAMSLQTIDEVYQIQKTRLDARSVFGTFEMPH